MVHTDTKPPPRQRDSALESAELQSALEEIHRAGVPGVVAAVRSGTGGGIPDPRAGGRDTVPSGRADVHDLESCHQSDADAGRSWAGAAGVADVLSAQPQTPGMRQRVGSITKTFTAVAVLQQAELGALSLDAPIGSYLPELVPGDRGRAITVRMLLNHTSGLADYLPLAFPSLRGLPDLSRVSPQSLDDNRFTRFRPDDLIRLGTALPATGEPGGTPGVYSNTNYLLLGRLLETVTGDSAEAYVARQVIEPAGLRDTFHPVGAHIAEPHPKMYEAMFGLVDPPRDYSVYDMSWVWMAADLVSTPRDLNRFFARLIGGRVVSAESLAQMQRTVPVISQEGTTIEYGLGLHRQRTSAGTYWGHDGTVWGAMALSLISDDGRRQMSLATNLVRWNRVDGAGRPQPHPIDAALARFRTLALET